MSDNQFSYRLPLIAFVALLVVSLMVHFTLTLVYSFRDNVPIAINQKVDRYMAPVFHQNWKLFAPDLPKYNCELQYRLVFNNEWTDWKDVSEDHGFGKTSPIETIEQNIVTQLNWQVLNNYYSRNGVIQFDRIAQSAAYTNAMFFALKMHRNFNPDKREEMFQIRVQYHFTSANGQNALPYEYLELPIHPADELK